MGTASPATHPGNEFLQSGSVTGRSSPRPRTPRPRRGSVTGARTPALAVTEPARGSDRGCRRNILTPSFSRIHTSLGFLGGEGGESIAAGGASRPCPGGESRGGHSPGHKHYMDPDAPRRSHGSRAAAGIRHRFGEGTTRCRARHGGGKDFSPLLASQNPLVFFIISFFFFFLNPKNKRCRLRRRRFGPEGNFGKQPHSRKTLWILYMTLRVNVYSIFGGGFGGGLFFIDEEI